MIRIHSFGYEHVKIEMAKNALNVTQYIFFCAGITKSDTLSLVFTDAFFFFFVLVKTHLLNNLIFNSNSFILITYIDKLFHVQCNESVFFFLCEKWLFF